MRTVFPSLTRIFNLWCFVLLVSCPSLRGDIEGSESDVVTLAPVTVNATRLETAIDSIPAAVSYIDLSSIQRGTQQLALDEAFKMVPGVFIQNPYNFAQDNRISIRGFGARANFGIRGIRLYIDGIPATTPDGQGSVDRISLGSVERIDVLRGPSSALYGAASGGVILLQTQEGTEIPFMEGRLAVGEDDFFETQLKAGGINGRLNYFLSATDLSYDGYRDNSRTESLKLNGKFSYALDEASTLRLVVSVIDIPIQDDPGGLTLAEAMADPRQARQRNLDFDSGERVEQETFGLVYEREWDDAHSLSASTYYIHRDFANKLPFESGGQVSFDRDFVGGSFQYNYQSDAARLSVGLDYDRQDDHRRNYDNAMGVRGPIVLDQNERVIGVGLFGLFDYELTDTVKFAAALRFDQIDFKVVDQLLTDGDDSGALEFEEFSPMVGINWLVAPYLTVFANVSTSFETPTTTELDNPNGGGFNTDLRSQTAESFELGARGRIDLAGRPLRYELTAFQIDIKDALVPFELPAFPDREFFRNAGSSERRGLEAAFSIELMPGLTASAMYTWSDFSYKEFVTDSADYSGNTTPGVPEHFGSIQLEYEHESGFFLRWTSQWIGSFYANDSNATEVDSYSVSDLRLGLEKTFGSWQVAPFVGINNVLDETYFSNIRLNAFGGRFYEPAPERYIYGGIRIQYTFD